MTEFAMVSGLKVNRQKTKVFPLARLADRPYTALPDVGLTWETKEFRYLGIRIEHWEQLQYDLNMGRVLTGLHNSIALWNKLPLSVIGMVAVSKMVVVPRCMYVLQNSMCDIGKKTFKELNSLLVSLVWTGKRSRVKQETLKLDPLEGGLGLPDLQLYLLQYAAQWSME
mgnify:CR=1 FL=1